jgi:hypothetical protein
MKFFISFILALSVTYAGNNNKEFTLSPVSDGYISRYTNSLAIVKDENTLTILNYDEQAGSYFEFFVSVENKCDSSITFDPLDIYSESFKNENDLSEKPEVLYSVDPDEQIKLIEKDIAKLKKQKEFNQGLNCLFGSVTVVAGAVSGNSEEADEINESILENIIAEEDDFEYNKFDLNQEKQFWQTEVLQSSLIRPGKKTAGYFFVPISPDAQWVQVVIPIGDKEYVFNFRQSTKHV